MIVIIMMSFITWWYKSKHRWINLQPLSVLTVHVQQQFNSNANTYLNGSISWNIQSWLRSSPVCFTASGFMQSGQLVKDFWTSDFQRMYHFQVFIGSFKGYSRLVESNFSVGFQYVPSELCSNLMSHLCCMATTFLTDASQYPSCNYVMLWPR